MIKLSEIRGAIHLSFRERIGLLGVMLVLAAMQSAKEYKKSWYQDPLPKDQLGQLFSFLEAHPVAAAIPEVETGKPEVFEKGERKRRFYSADYEKKKPETRQIEEPIAPVSIELNSTDSISLTSIRGVGGWSARKVLRFRDALGGFHSLNQLDEVYGLHEEVKAALKEQVLLDTLALSTINLDTCSVDLLASHPYISWKLAKTMIAYRDQHGPLHNVGQIRDCYLINDSIFARIKPYLNVTFESATN